MSKMKPGAKINAYIILMAAGIFAQQTYSFTVSASIVSEGAAEKHLLAGLCAAAALIFTALAIIKAMPQPVEEELIETTKEL